MTAAIWLTGYSGAGKSTIAALLHAALPGSVLLDGDTIRRGLNSDLGFSNADRAENIRRVAEVARLIVASRHIAIVALISPFRADRDLARAKFAPGQFVEVFVDTPLAVAEARDVKGLYRRARAGQLPQFTGIDSPYEAPLYAEIRVDPTLASAAQCAEKILRSLTLN
jgi:adenylyl-sulfate kinase